MDRSAGAAQMLCPGVLRDGNGNFYFAPHRIVRANATLGYLVDDDALAAVIGELVTAAALEHQRDLEERARADDSSSDPPNTPEG